MKNFKVYFEVFGKKMKTTINASSKEDAENKVRNKIIFHKVEREVTHKQESPPKFEVPDIFKDIFNL